MLKGNVSRETFLFDLWNWTYTCDTLQIMEKSQIRRYVRGRFLISGGMEMFWNKKKKIEKEEYDHSQYTPAIRSSICTGEKTGGLLRNATGEFSDRMLIRTEEGMERFLEQYDVRKEDIKYIY